MPKALIISVCEMLGSRLLNVEHAKPGPMCISFQLLRMITVS